MSYIEPKVVSKSIKTLFKESIVFVLLKSKEINDQSTIYESSIHY